MDLRYQVNDGPLTPGAGSARPDGMPVNPDTTVRKNVAMSKELWEQVRTWRFRNEINTESEAIRRLVEAGLQSVGTKQPKGGKSR
jgi:hypothetical protein